MASFEDGNSYEEIVARSLERVATDVDKREGSVVHNGIAPASAELSLIYILLDAIYENGFADTAEREWLIRRAKERGLSPHPATYAVLNGEFNMEIPIGSRFNLDELNYEAIEYIDSTTVDEVTTYNYQLRCEELGTEGNAHFGAVEPIDFIADGLEGAITELLIPAQDEEDTEVFRARYMNSFSDTPFGGNQADYKNKALAIDGVGGVKIIPVWDGGGTVKVIIINSNYDKASSILVAAAQEIIDPVAHTGDGKGTAPIGHTVTVVSCEEVTVNISARVTLEDGYTWEGLLSDITAAVEAYLLEIRTNWANTDTPVVRVSQVENRILNVDGVLDIQDTEINGSSSNLTLDFKEIPVLGVITNVAT